MSDEQIQATVAGMKMSDADKAVAERRALAGGRRPGASCSIEQATSLEPGDERRVGGILSELADYLLLTGYLGVERELGRWLIDGRAQLHYCVVHEKVRGL